MVLWGLIIAGGNPCCLQACNKVLKAMQGLLDLLSKRLAAACSSPAA
jgi:hypothetical protein